MAVGKWSPTKVEGDAENWYVMLWPSGLVCGPVEGGETAAKAFCDKKNAGGTVEKELPRTKLRPIVGLAANRPPA